MPFAEKLAEAIDHHRVEARRAFPHLLVMMQASALLHQRQRNVDSNGRLLADIGDYQLARHLLVGPMARAVGVPYDVRRAGEALPGAVVGVVRQRDLHHHRGAETRDGFPNGGLRVVD